MATPVVIPFGSSAPWFEQPVTIDSELYAFSFYFNVRANRWFLDIADEQGNSVVQGICVQIDRELAGHVSYKILSNVTLYCQDDSNLGREPSLVSFLSTHTLGYESAS